MRFQQKMKVSTGFFIATLWMIVSVSFGQQKVIWEIGKADNNNADMTLSPKNYTDFLKNDFGWEDRYFLVGYSNAKTQWPYILPGPKDNWAGTGQNSGIRSQVLNILFGIKALPLNANCNLTICLLGYHGSLPPLLKIVVNSRSFEFQLPPGGEDKSIEGDFSHSNKYKATISLKNGLLRKGGNEINVTSLDGSWLVFDQIRMESSKNISLIKPKHIFIRQVKPADYEIRKDAKFIQPLLVNVHHLNGKPKFSVKLDGKMIFKQILDSGQYEFEVPMPAVLKAKKSRYEIFSDDQLIENGTVDRRACRVNTFADYVDTKLGSAHSRWMIAPGPWTPFSMVKLSPDNQNSGWMGGYDPTFESIGTFSHIHEWTMAGLGIMPTGGILTTNMGDQREQHGGYRSQIDKQSESAPLGYYKVMLKDYQIKAELTATPRCSFQRYTYSKAGKARVIIDLKIPAEYDYNLETVTLKQVNSHCIEGFSRQYTRDVWSGGVNQEYTIYFVIEFDRSIKKFGTWVNNKVFKSDATNILNPKKAGAYVEFENKGNQIVQIRTGISLVSLAGAENNLYKEITKPFKWNFNQVYNSQKQHWNNLLGRLEIVTNDRREKVRFYSNMFRALASRNTWSDIDGHWIDASKNIQQLPDSNDLAMGCDAFWNTFWNLNQFWNLATPEWSSKWVKSQLAMYDAGGWLAKGPAGMNYVPVMVAEHEIPLIVSAYQMGIRDFDAQKALKAVYKMQTTPAQKVGKAGFAGNEDLAAYLKYKYVPYDLGRFSNTLEYAYDDWTVSQFAKALGDNSVYQEFINRSGYWKNVIDGDSGYARLRNSDGTWFANFDPFKSGANKHYVEGNAWQLTYYVPQNIPGLVEAIGTERFADRLEWGFAASYKWRFNAPEDNYWDYPVMQGNEQTMHLPYLFNWIKKPWLTQKWSRAIIDRYYGYGVANAYLGDEDQGQMSAWFIMSAIGLFQTDGGANLHPIYEIGSPIFPKVVIHLNGQFGRGKSFTIKAENVSRNNKYIHQALLNGKELNSFWFPVQKLLKGGVLDLKMGERPSRKWGTATLPPVEN